MSSRAANRFSAAGPAIGYLAQIEYGLLVLLRRMDDTVDLRLSMETADDLTLEATDVDSARELWQTKHHLAKTGSLGNASPDLWKSLNNWIESASDSCQLILFSTASAQEGSAARLLGTDPKDRDVATAQELLEEVASAAGNTAHVEYYARFLDLDPSARSQLLERVTVLGEATQGIDLTEALRSAVRKTVRENRRVVLVERLRGWWHQRALEHLSRVATGRVDWIEMAEVESKLHRIAESLRVDNLPLDFTDLPEPTEDEANVDDRIFVEQLKLIMLHHERIRMAIHDHNRAFRQRSVWLREDLIDPGELAAYDRRLIQEWKRVFLPVEDTEEDPDINESDRRRDALQRYVALEGKDLPEIKRDIQSGYVPCGSLHILADRLRIGWHHDWIELLRYRIGEAGGMPLEDGAA